MTVTATILLLSLMGCGVHEITSSPPGATVHVYQAGGMHPVRGPWSVDNKPTPEQMVQLMEKSHPVVTPYTCKGGPFDRWYQVRKEGYLDSDIIFLEEAKGTLSHHFTLEKRP